MENPVRITLDRGDALLIVDVQNDFLSGGSLAVPGADAILPTLVTYIASFTASSLPVVASRDWHPANHCSFLEQGGKWPAHCVAGSPGAEFPQDLLFPEDVLVISKAVTAEKEAYSAFQNTDLNTQLNKLGVHRLFIGGLATDYCVFETVKDAITLEYTVLILADAVRAVNADEGVNALSRMKDLGADEIKRNNFSL